MSYDTYDQDLGAPDVRTIDRRTHRTRKERTLPCGHTVPKGTLYRKWVGIIDGEFTVMIECTQCYADSMS